MFFVPSPAPRAPSRSVRPADSPCIRRNCILAHTAPAVRSSHVRYGQTACMKRDAYGTAAQQSLPVQAGSRRASAMPSIVFCCPLMYDAFVDARREACGAYVRALSYPPAAEALQGLRDEKGPSPASGPTLICFIKSLNSLRLSWNCASLDGTQSADATRRQTRQLTMRDARSRAALHTPAVNAAAVGVLSRQPPCAAPQDKRLTCTGRFSECVETCLVLAVRGAASRRPRKSAFSCE